VGARAPAVGARTLPHRAEHPAHVDRGATAARGRRSRPAQDRMAPGAGDATASRAPSIASRRRWRRRRPAAGLVGWPGRH
jgi:hypothetical protein